MNNIDYRFLTNEWYDVPISKRVRRERNIAELYDKSILISIHADAFHVKNKAQGGTFFYYSPAGKILAEKFTTHFVNKDYDLVVRKAKYGNFKILRETSSTAILFEAGFMTTLHDLEYLLSDKFRNKTAILLFNAIREIIF